MKPRFLLAVAMITGSFIWISSCGKNGEPEVTAPQKLTSDPSSPGGGRDSVGQGLSSSLIQNQVLGDAGNDRRPGATLKSVDDAKELMQTVGEMIDVPDRLEPKVAAASLREAAGYFKLYPVEDPKEQGKRETVMKQLWQIARQLETRVETPDDAVRVLGQLNSMMEMYFPS